MKAVAKRGQGGQDGTEHDHTRSGGRQHVACRGAWKSKASSSRNSYNVPPNNRKCARRDPLAISRKTRLEKFSQRGPDISWYTGEKDTGGAGTHMVRCPPRAHPSARSLLVLSFQTFNHPSLCQPPPRYTGMPLRSAACIASLSPSRREPPPRSRTPPHRSRPARD